jgi:formamidopyrimidine-DNA glycosylase
MPELPDLLSIRTYLRNNLTGSVIESCEVRQPVVLRTTIDQPPQETLAGRSFVAFDFHGPFLTITLSPPLSVVINLMLAGKLQHQRPGEHPEGHLCVALHLRDGSTLRLCDEQKMAKVYLVHPGEEGKIPRYTEQGIDVLSPQFTLDRFRALAAKNGRKQVRVFLNTHALLSAIGNAYADEILFDARIHPKTFVARLSPEEIERLWTSIRGVMVWGIAQVERAGQPIHVKVRDHLRVRNRKGEPCPRCGTTIRREGVRGYDVFFCPVCQPASRDLFIDWRKDRDAP